MISYDQLEELLRADADVASADGGPKFHIEQMGVSHEVVTQLAVAYVKDNADYINNLLEATAEENQGEVGALAVLTALFVRGFSLGMHTAKTLMLEHTVE